MKKFDLEEAINGKAFVLKNGYRGVIKYSVDNNIMNNGSVHKFSYIGYILTKSGHLYIPATGWSLDGENRTDQELDAVGMWEEPKLTSEQVLEKAYNEDLLVLCDGNPDLPLKIIAKTKDGEFVMQPEDDTIQPWLANLTMEWFFAKDLDPKFDTITNTIALPKPFKPKDGESYYYICGGNIEHMRKYAEVIHSDSASAQNGQCFRTKEDAQKWLDFMKSMME